MKLIDAPIVINISYKLNEDGEYKIVLSFDTGDTQEFPIDSSIVDSNKLTFWNMK